MVELIPMWLRPYIFTSVKVLLLIAVGTAMYQCISYISKYRILQRALRDAYNQMDLNDKQRSAATKKEREMKGEEDARGFISKVDKELLYSGIKGKLPWLNSELYLVFLAVLFLLVFIVTGFLTKNIILGILIDLILFVVQKAILSLLGHVQYSRTEKSLLQFMNIIENFAMSSDDLINILERSCSYLEEPLKSAVLNAVIEARNTGDSLTAMKNLQGSVEHKFFKSFIRNLEVCSRFDTNYKDIISDSRHVLEIELKNEKERQAIYTNGRGEIIAMIFCGLACMLLMGKITGGGNVITLLAGGGAFGYFILGFCVFTLLVAIYFAFIANMKH